MWQLGEAKGNRADEDPSQHLEPLLKNKRPAALHAVRCYTIMKVACLTSR